MRVYLITCLLFLTISSYAQVNCPVKYYGKSFHHLGHTGGVQLLLLSSGNAFLSSNMSGGCTLIKVDHSGDTVWKKFYKTQNKTSSISRILLTKDSHLIALINNNLLKLDTNGNVLSSALIELPVYLPSEVALADNEDVVVLFGSNSDGSLLVRYSKDFSTVVWSKQVQFKNNFSYSSNGALESMVIDGNDIIAGGAAAGNAYPSKYHTVICRFNANTGELSYFKYFKEQKHETTIRKLYKCKDGYLALGHLYKDLTSHYSYLRIDRDLNITIAKKIEDYASYIHQNSFVLLPMPDNSFYISYGQTWTLSLALVNKTDSLLWVKDVPGLYNYPTDLEQRNDGLYFAGINNFNNVVTNGPESGIELVKTDFEGNLNGCRPETPVKLKLDEVLFNENNVSYTVKPFEVPVNPSTITQNNYTLDASAFCTGESICNSLKISGDTVVCNTLPIKLEAIKNASCKNMVNWSVFPSDGSIIDVKNSTAASVQFSKSGNYVVHVFTNTPCGKLEDSITIHVNLSASLNIGADTYLCSGDSLVLRAGSQFKKYTWQDGSADSTFIVRTAGKYYVSVIDYCNNQYVDTILIKGTAQYILTAGSDTAKCNSDSITLHATPGFIQYSWGPNINIINAKTAAPTIFPSTATSFYVDAQTPEGCIISDTVFITVNNSPLLFIGNDTTLCEGDSVILNAGAGFSTYLWNTGDTTASITSSTSGAYSLMATASNGCISKDSMMLSFNRNPQVHLIDDSVLCYGASRILDAGAGFSEYAWNTGGKNRQITVNNIGNYSVIVADKNGCQGSDTTIITEIANLPSGFLTADTSMCDYDTLLLQSKNIYSTYLWSVGSTESFLKVNEPANYWLQVKDSNNCINREYVNVKEKECYRALYFPTAFTPNRDRLNDVFRPIVYGSLSAYRLNIYNRFGEMIFSATDAARGWDGTIKGQPQNTGSFVWVCTYQLKGGEKKAINGMVTLIH